MRVRVISCSSVLFLLQTCLLVLGLQEMLRPHESRCASPGVAPPRSENKPCPVKYALRWPLDLGGVQLGVGGVRSGFTAHYGLCHRTTQRACYWLLMQLCVCSDYAPVEQTFGSH